MAINALSPAFVKMRYSLGTHQHTATFPTKFSGTPVPGDEPDLLTHANNARLFSLCVASVSNVLTPLMGSTMTIDFFDIWSQPTPADDPVWIYTFGADDDGTSAGPAITAQQQVFTFRTSLGGIYRLYLMEGAVTANLSLSYGAMGADSKSVADTVMEAAGWIYGRDGGAPVVSLGYKTKYNDVLRRNYLTG